jgi:phosphomethylpyrimidine synthase
LIFEVNQRGRDIPAKQNAPLEDSIAVEEAGGMAEISEKYRAGGDELYIGAGGRKHD